MSTVLPGTLVLQGPELRRRRIQFLSNRLSVGRWHLHATSSRSSLSRAAACASCKAAASELLSPAALVEDEAAKTGSHERAPRGAVSPEHADLSRQAANSRAEVATHDQND